MSPSLTCSHAVTLCPCSCPLQGPTFAEAFLQPLVQGRRSDLGIQPVFTSSPTVGKSLICLGLPRCPCLGGVGVLVPPCRLWEDGMNEVLEPRLLLAHRSSPRRGGGPRGSACLLVGTHHGGPCFLRPSPQRPLHHACPGAGQGVSLQCGDSLGLLRGSAELRADQLSAQWLIVASAEGRDVAGLGPSVPPPVLALFSLVSEGVTAFPRSVSLDVTSPQTKGGGGI